MKYARNKNIQLCIFLSWVVMILPSCHQKTEEQVSKNYLLEGEIIVIPDSSNIKSKLKIVKVIREPYLLKLYSAAKVTAIPNKYAQISAPFNGRIMQAFVILGSKTEQGTPLFSINSSEYADAQKLFLQDKQQFILAEKEYKRQTDLLDHGVGVQRDLEAAKTNFEVTKSEYEKAQSSIRIFGVDPDKMVFGEPLIVRSPIKGEVISNQLVVGKYLTDNSSAVIIVAELSNVWITATVKEKDIRFIQEDDVTEAQVTAYPGKIFHGKIYHINEVVDEDTRSIQVLIDCPNQDRKLKPGMYATVKFTDPPVDDVTIPVTALLQFNDKNYVFLQVAPNKYQRRSVTTGETTNGRILITEGLIGGETIISEGGFYLQDAK